MHALPNALPNVLGQRTGKLSIFLTYVDDALPLVIVLASTEDNTLSVRLTISYGTWLVRSVNIITKHIRTLFEMRYHSTLAWWGTN